MTGSSRVVVVYHLLCRCLYPVLVGLAADNLGVVFGPNIFRVPVDPANPLEAVTHTKSLNTLLSAWIASSEVSVK
jgi:hypothetical protein